MIEIKPYLEHAVLVGLITPSQPEEKTKEYLDELAFLADTHGIVPVKRFTQRLDQPNTSTYVGEGKLEEIRQYIVAREQNQSVSPKDGLYSVSETVCTLYLPQSFAARAPSGRAVEGEGMRSRFLVTQSRLRAHQTPAEKSYSRLSLRSFRRSRSGCI